MITKDNFVCDRTCADCCQHMLVRLTKKDIDSIKKAGFNDFFEYDSHIKSNVLKITNNQCMFLGKKAKEFYCKIYNIRPKICRIYPFVKSDNIESCKPKLLKNRSFL